MKKQTSISFRVFLLLAVWPCLFLNLRAEAPPAVELPTVGMEGEVEVVLPGPELEAKPLDDDTSPILLEIRETYPHGTAFRYDIRYYGLEPGEYDLTEYLQRKDGAELHEVPPVMVSVRPLLEPGAPLELNRPAGAEPFFFSGYKLVLLILGIFWFLVFCVILFWPTKKKKETYHHIEREPTFAERLRPLVEKGMNGELTTGEQASLERMLLSFWRKRLGLEGMEPHEALSRLRRDEEAGELLRQLEQWLHSPHKSEDVNLKELLKPYQNVRESDLEPPRQAETVPA